MLLYAAIITYILSNIIALALLFTGKKLGNEWLRILASLHIVLGIIFLFNYFTNQSTSPRYVSFLFFFCSGIITGGLALSKNTNIAVKIYFGLYCCSVFIFLVSPSALLNFLVTANFSAHSGMIPLRNNYFLERQSSTFSSDTIQVRYKLIEKTGMFHRTIARDLDFRGTLDSVKLISFEDQKSADVRGYISKKTFVEDVKDSTDLMIDLNPQKKDEIERRL